MRNKWYAACTGLLLISISGMGQNKLGLADAKSMAISNNVKIENSMLEIAAAKNTLEGAKTYYYPQVRADGILMYAVNPLMEISSPGGDLPVYDGNPANLANATNFAYFPASQTGILQQMGVANLSISQPIYTGGKIKIGNEMAAKGVAIREEQKRMSEQELLLTVEQQYWQIVALQEKQKTIDSFRELLEQLAIQVNDAYKAGLIIRNDIYKVQLEQSQLAINENKLRNGRALALRQFSHTIGTDYDSTLVLQENLDDHQAPEYYLEVGRAYLSGLSEVKLLERSAEIQQLQVELSEAEFKPTVALGVNAFYLTQFEEHSGGVNAFGMLSVGMPLSHLWMGKHEVQEQKIKAAIAQNTLEDTKKLLELRTAKSWTDLREAYAHIQIMRERIEQANENLRVNQSSYDSGVVTLSDLLEAKALQTQALDEMIEAKTNYKVAIVTYLLYTGK